MKIKPATVADVQQCDPSDVGVNLDLVTQTYAMSAFTEEDELVTVFGIVVAWPGVGFAWMLTGPAFEKVTVRTAELIRNSLELAINSLHLHRVEATAEKVKQKHCEFLNWLGFEIEGTARKYGPDKQDHVRFARVL